MKKILFLLLIPISLFSQKKEYFYDYNWNQISKKDYNDRSLYKALRIKIDKDSVILNKLEHGLEPGILHLDSLAKLRTYLKKITKRNLSKDHMVVINYYPGTDPCNSGGSRTKAEYRFHYKRYLKKLKKLGKIDQFFIYKSNDGLDRFTSDYAVWFEDSNGKIENTFFRFHYPCYSFVIINSDGKYFVRKSEYAIDDVYRIIDFLRD